jgi:hypothetical protein
MPLNSLRSFFYDGRVLAKQKHRRMFQQGFA